MNDLRLCIYAEELNSPFDEGVKNFTYNIFRQAPRNCEVLRISSGDADVIDCRIKPNLFLLSPDLRKAIHQFRPDALIYIPTTSITPASFVRSRMLKLYAGAVPVLMIGVQPRHFSTPVSLALRTISPDIVYVQSEASTKELRRAGFRAEMISTGVDAEKFHPVSESEKLHLRKKYDIDPRAYVILHVGHIKERRNLRVLGDLMPSGNTQVVIVGSSSTAVDHDLESWLIDRGVKVLGGYVEKIEEIYQLADLYVFPVVQTCGAIELPLSVLEAMACNLPVVTTEFGGLADILQEGEGMYFVDDPDKLADKVNQVRQLTGVDTRRKAEQFTWEAVAERLFTEVEHLAVRKSGK